MVGGRGNNNSPRDHEVTSWWGGINFWIFHHETMSSTRGGGRGGEVIITHPETMSSIRGGVLSIFLFSQKICQRTQSVVIHSLQRLKSALTVLLTPGEI